MQEKGLGKNFMPNLKAPEYTDWELKNEIVLPSTGDLLDYCI